MKIEYEAAVNESRKYDLSDCGGGYGEWELVRAIVDAALPDCDLYQIEAKAFVCPDCNWLTRFEDMHSLVKVERGDE